jgi:ketosteroid isomerase-like protein
VSPENVEIARRALTAAFVSEPPDTDTLRELLDPDVVVTSNWGVEGAVHQGVDGALAARAEMSSVWDTWEQQIERIVDAGDRGVVAFLRLRATGRGSAVPVEFAWAMVATLHHGRITSGRTFLSHAEALEAVGLEE